MCSIVATHIASYTHLVSKIFSHSSKFFSSVSKFKLKRIIVNYILLIVSSYTLLIIKHSC